MISYVKASRANIAELCPALQRLLDRYADVAPAELDLSIICGHRGEAEQNKAYAEGKSKARWPHSAHNATPSRAFDFIPYPFTSWEDRYAFVLRQGALRLVAAQHGVGLKPLIPWDPGHVEVA